MKSLEQLGLPRWEERRHWCGTIDDYEWVFDHYGLDVVVTGCWRGTGTVLLVLSSRDGTPIASSSVQWLRAMLAPWWPVNAVVTIVAAG